ncbi:MAG TPA: SurA N-terminal domain-containing protein [Gammaproteobacteria bacterium]|nr:SurA N-terminal domain-containing protein [Gammaproteobacteria bacterium]
MLQSIRDKTTGWIAVAIVALLIIPFAFWGINYYFSGGTEPVVAKVNGEKIKLSQYQRTYTNYRTQMQALFDRNIGPDDEAMLKQQTLLKLVESELLNQKTRDAGLRVSDKQVRETIKNIDLFKSENGFNRDYYEQSVQQLGMTPATYEQQMRLDMMSEQLQSAIIESEFATREEALKLARLNNQQRDLNYVTIPVSRFADSIEISDEDIESWYQQHPQSYIQPEAVRIAYVELKLDDLAKSVHVSDEDLQAYYQDNKAQYDQEEQRKITQILFKTDKDMPADKRAEMKAEAGAVLEKIRAGSNFEDIVSEYSDNQNPAIVISEYGFMAKGILQDEVDGAAFSMNVGDVSDVIESDIGFHVIKVEDIKGGAMNTFENNRELVEKDYRKKLAEEQFFELADQLGTLAFEHPDSLVVASEETGLPIRKTGFFDREGSKEGLTAIAEVVDASFSDDVLQEGLNSDILEVNDRDLLVLRVDEHREKARQPLSEVRDEVIGDIRFDRASRLARETGERIIKSLDAGESFSSIAEREQIEWNTETDIKRDDLSVNRSILRQAFSLPRPGGDGPSVAGVAQGTGDYAVVAVLAAREPEADSIKGKEIEKTRSQLEASRSGQDWQRYLDQLMADADISLFRDRIQ